MSSTRHAAQLQPSLQAIGSLQAEIRQLAADLVAAEQTEDAAKVAFLQTRIMKLYDKELNFLPARAWLCMQLSDQC